MRVVRAKGRNGHGHGFNRKVKVAQCPKEWQSANLTKVSLWKVSRDMLKVLCTAKEAVKINPWCKNAYAVLLLLNCDGWSISHATINHINQDI